MKLWQKNTDVNKTIEDFTVGNDRELDLLLAGYDVLGSMAHIIMLEKVGLLNPEELDRLLLELKRIKDHIDKGDFIIEEGVEDVHSQVEFLLIESLGDLGKKIHSGRSRNDQVLLDLKLYIRNEIAEIVHLVQDLFDQLIDLSEQYKDHLLSGYTHFQVAMPSSFGLWFGAFAESLVDDVRLLITAFDMANQNPLGSAAGYGSSFPLDRQFTTDLLGFESMHSNVVYAQMGRGKTEKFAAVAIGSVADTLGKLAMDVCLYMNQNFGFISFPEEYTTGSSIMPHKKNPDVFEIIRGRCNRIRGLVNDINLVAGNLPSGYHREMQLLKESVVEGILDIKSCIYMTGFMFEKVIINENILDDPKYDYLFSVELVNQFVLEGMPFRDAYRKVGEMIREGTFNAPKNIIHTHEGSLGNLHNGVIKAKMKSVTEGFDEKETRIEKAYTRLIDF
jgi:argininosuccinate lyase